MINSQCRLYLRASTKDQDEQRARFALEQFAAERQLSIVGVYADSISGTKIDRPALAKLLELGDGQVFGFTHQLISGHSLKHLVAALAALPVLSAFVALRKRPSTIGD